jgi:hypothetical protein
MQFPGDRSNVGAPTGQFGETRGTEGATSDEISQGLQEVGFPLGVRPGDEVQLGRGPIGKGAIITEFQ